MAILDDDELKKLTGRTRAKNRCDKLREMGIAFGLRWDGQPVVTTEAVQAFTGEVQAEEKGTLRLS